MMESIKLDIHLLSSPKLDNRWMPFEAWRNYEGTMADNYTSKFSSYNSINLYMEHVIT